MEVLKNGACNFDSFWDDALRQAEGLPKQKKTKLSGKRKSACIFQTTLAEIGYLNFNQNKSTTINKCLLKF